MDLRLSLAILVGKAIAIATKLSGGGATAAPGLYALKVDPHLVKKLAAKLGQGSIVITGTNGKTTTSRLISSLIGNKYHIVHNRQGSNLLRGIASTLISAVSVGGNLGSNLGLWEVDEATLGEVVENIDPKTIILLNLFRDQLDRYGEVETVRQKWEKALSKIPSSVNLIFNADDPQLSYLAGKLKVKDTGFGIEDTRINLPQTENVADIRFCLNCGKKLIYSSQFSSHMGHYKCSSCAFKRPKVDICAGSLRFNNDFSSDANFSDGEDHFKLKMPMPGLYSIYNVLGAVALAKSEGIENTEIQSKVEDFSSAFGRFQEIVKNGKRLIIFLIKNPTGANEVLRTIAMRKDLHILVCLNDKIADGKDVSWVWDTNWEVLQGKVTKAAVSGRRCWDMATRLKYAQIDVDNNSVHDDINYLINTSLNNMSNKNTLIVLPTYTAMLEIQRAIGEKWQTE